MPELTQIVRPYAVANIRPLLVPTKNAPPADPPEGVLIWGKSGDSVFSQDGAHYGGKMDPSKDQKEMKRTYDTVRVSKEDDPDTYVDTEVMTAYEVADTIDPSRVQISPDRYILRFAKTQESDTVKILKSGQTRVSQP
jgi:hypothetical protein